ncbi:MAG TPA: quinoprotein relay system zinc metallohydrolase 2 [Methylococcaceae bacterium]|nr:quinoprotein relay system zinc metallohydrolase 2 [Methylococcaceae bacterium]
MPHCLLILLVFFWARAASAAEPPFDVSEIAPGVFVHQGAQAFPDRHNQGEIANIGFIVGERCVAVIDSGGNPAQGEALKAAVAAKTKTPVCYVVNTHVHPDHIFGNRAFKSKGIQFVGHHNLARSLALRGSHYLQTAARDLALSLTADALVPPDLSVDDTLMLDLGGRRIKLTAHRSAHTDNDLSVYDEHTQTLWLADLLFVEHVPTLDGSLMGWLATLNELATWPVKRVIPGHGAVRQDWPGALEPEKQYLLMLRDEIRALIQRGGTLETALARVGQAARPRWALFDDYHQRNVSTAFAELEWEE